MLRFDPLLTASPATAPNAAPASPAGPVGSGAGFSALFREIRTEVADFIANGAGGEDTAPASFSAEGRIRHALLSAPAMRDESPDPADARQAFIASIAPMAREAGAALGVSADIITAHAALESGWGQRPLRNADGSSSHNLFGVKAGSAWRGDVARAATTEYEEGVAQGRVDDFRSFPDQASAFRDFVKLIRDNPRYHGALNAGNDVAAYARGLVRGGYATDPAYAEKLARVAASIQSAE